MKNNTSHTMMQNKNTHMLKDGMLEDKVFESVVAGAK